MAHLGPLVKEAEHTQLAKPLQLNYSFYLYGFDVDSFFFFLLVLFLKGCLKSPLSYGLNVINSSHWIKEMDTFFWTWKRYYEQK